MNKIQPPSTLLLPLLMALLSLSYFSSGMYIPAIPSVENYFSTTPELTKLTQAFYLFGLALSQLIYGPISDAIGRRTPLLIGLVLLLFGTTLCALATSIHFLIIARLIQGMGAGAGLSLTRAILRDHYSGKDLARIASYFTINAFVFTSGSPLIGSVILQYSNWRWMFGFILLATFFFLVMSSISLQESNPYKNIELIKPVRLKQNLYSIFSDRIFVSYSLITFCSFCALMGWFTLSPILIQKYHQFTPIQFGVLMLGMGLINAFGGIINSRLAARIELPTLVKRGLITTIGSAVYLFTISLLGIETLAPNMIGIIVFTFSFTFIFANAFALAFSKFEKSAGLASAVFASFQTLGGASGSVIMSFSPNHTILPFALMLLAVSIIALVIVLMTPAE